MSGSNLIHFSDDEFENQVLKSNDPVLVDFWAPWCGPCKATGPIVEDLAEEYSGRVKIGKMNVDDNPKTPGKYGIRAIPTLLVFKGGEVAEQIIGAVPKSQVVDALKKVL